MTGKWLSQENKPPHTEQTHTLSCILSLLPMQRNVPRLVKEIPGLGQFIKHSFLLPAPSLSAFLSAQTRGSENLFCFSLKHQTWSPMSANASGGLLKNGYRGISLISKRKMGLKPTLHFKCHMHFQMTYLFSAAKKSWWWWWWAGGRGDWKVESLDMSSSGQEGDSMSITW